MTCKDQFKTLSNGLLVRAPAKINLSLLIAGKRPDGFHEIETIMAKVNYYDEILIRHGRKSGIELICKGPYRAPEGKGNLVYQACEMLLKDYRPNADIRLTLTKNIPAGSGLGSASSDAAAALLGLNNLLKLNITGENLHRMAVKLGSDVPFFLGGPLAFCCGKGEKIEKIEKIFNFLTILVLPDVTISTKKVYENYKHNNTLYKTLKTQIRELAGKNRIDLVARMCANMLAESCLYLNKELVVLKSKIELLNIGPVCLTGSGSGMFCLVEGDEKTARKYKRIITDKIGCKSVIVSNNNW